MMDAKTLEEAARRLRVTGVYLYARRSDDGSNVTRTEEVLSDNPHRWGFTTAPGSRQRPVPHRPSPRPNP